MKSVLQPASPHGGRDREAGYTLVVMIMVVIVFNVAVATAWPIWSTLIQREKEEELIFRGLQYAEAIRVFQKRFGRYPTRLEELIEIEPRSIRRLWLDPMTEDGSWALIYGTPAAPPGGDGGRGQPGAVTGINPSGPKPGESPEPQPPGGGDSESGPTRGGQPGPGGPIVGVFSKSKESGVKTFFGREQYSEWKFSADLVSDPPMGPTGFAHPRSVIVSSASRCAARCTRPAADRPREHRGRPPEERARARAVGGKG